MHKMTGYKNKDYSYRNQSYALKFGHSLNKCGYIKNPIALIEGNDESSRNVDAVFTLCEYN